MLIVNMFIKLLLLIYNYCKNVVRLQILTIFMKLFLLTLINL